MTLAVAPGDRLVQLRLDCFEGPLELLLRLIEQRRLPITDVSLTAVADQYLAQIRALPELDADLLADFLAIGGKLLVLKSRALLLTDTPDPAEEEDSASDLAARLETYRVFRAAAESLQKLEERGLRAYPTVRDAAASLAAAPLAPIAPEALLAVWRQLRTRREPELAPLPVVVRASVDEKRRLILDLLKTRQCVSFGELAGVTVDEVVASFLAVLELSRRRLVAVQQSAAFGDILLSRVAQHARDQA